MENFARMLSSKMFLEKMKSVIVLLYSKTVIIGK